jgi:hypothetical protein
MRFAARSASVLLSYLVTIVVIGMALRDLWRRPATSSTRRVLGTLAIVSIGGAAGYVAPIGALAHLIIGRRPAHSSPSAADV